MSSAVIRTPPRMQPMRDSAASGGFASIGNMLSSPYDEEPSTPLPITPQTPQRTSPMRPRIGTVRGEMYTPPGKSHLLDRVQSFEGQVDDHDQFDDDDDEIMLAFDRPSPSKLHRVYDRQSEESGRVRPQTIIDFPEPTLASPIPLRVNPRPHFHRQASDPIIPQQTRVTPQRPHIQIPTPTHSPSRHDQYTIPALPCSGTPISPHLAAPPSLLPPQSPFGPNSSGRRGSTGSDSIKGFDMMKEKKALFRGGEEELFTPFSPRKQRRQESGLRHGFRKSTMRGGQWSRLLEEVQRERKA